MSRFVDVKWRPSLLLVLGGSLMAILVLPIWGAFIADVLTPLMGRGNAVWAVAACAFLSTLVLGWLLWRLILGPVQELAERAEAIRGGAAPLALEHYGTPEIAELGQAVLDMAQVLQNREMAVRGYTNHVTHELKTPLTAIRGAAELLSMDENLPAESRQLVQTIEEAEARAVKLLAAAREIAAAREPEHHGDSRLRDILPELQKRHASLIVKASKDRIPLPLAPSGLSIVLGHLAENAAEAGATQLTLETGRQTDRRPWLSVTDNGPGISQGNATQVFEPFFTTRREMGGTGMGLAIVQTLCLAHGATVTLEPSDTGTRFKITF